MIYSPTAAAVAALVFDCSPDERESLRRELNNMVVSSADLDIQGLLPSGAIKGGVTFLTNFVRTSEET